MEIIGTLMDEGTREWIKGATITVLDTVGKPTGQAFPANNYGSFVATVPVGSHLLISHVNYYPVKLSAQFFENGDVLEMQRKGGDLDEVVVTATKNKNGSILLWIIGGVVVSKLLKLW